MGQALARRRPDAARAGTAVLITVRPVRGADRACVRVLLGARDDRARVQAILRFAVCGCVRVRVGVWVKEKGGCVSKRWVGAQRRVGVRSYASAVRWLLI